MSTDEYKRIYTKWYSKPEPFWNARRVAYLMGGVLFITVISVSIWRYSTLVRINKKMAENITERKQAEKALQLERDKIVNILNSMEDGVYIVNQQYDIEYVNPVIEKEFGKADGRKCYEFFHELKEVCPWCKNPEVMAGNTVHWEWHSQKNQKTYDLIDTPLRNPDGSISKLEIFRDITERKQTEDELEKHREHMEELVKERTAELEEKNRDLKRFNKLFVDRELRIGELKKEIESLKKS